MEVTFLTQTAVDEWLAEVGFVKDDDKWYWGADTERKSYFNMVANGTGGSATYTGSNGTAYTLASGGNSSFPYWGVDYYELKGGGIAMKFAYLATASTPIDTPIHFAIVAKEDGSGFVYFVHNNNILYDDLSETLVNPSRWTATNLNNTNSIAMIVRMFNSVDSFIEARAMTVLAAQNVAASLAFTFECGGKKYLSGMYTGNSAIKLGQIVFEID